MIRALVCLLVFSFSGLSFAAELPQVVVNNVPHYLVESDDVGDRWYETADGYCSLQGKQYASMSSSYKAQVAPLAILDRKGNVLQTFDSNPGTLWVLAEVNCVGR